MHLKVFIAVVICAILFWVALAYYGIRNPLFPSNTIMKSVSLEAPLNLKFEYYSDKGIDNPVPLYGSDEMGEYARIPKGSDFLRIWKIFNYALPPSEHKRILQKYYSDFDTAGTPEKFERSWNNREEISPEKGIVVVEPAVFVGNMSVSESHSLVVVTRSSAATYYIRGGINPKSLRHTQE